jgi:hypothetical protein
MKLPRRKFLHLAAGAAALPAVSRFARPDNYAHRSVRIGCTLRIAQFIEHYQPGRLLVLPAARCPSSEPACGG